MKNKIQAIIYRTNKQQAIEILALRRTQNRGGNWQPITGGVDEGENFEEALIREIKEEIGIEEIIKYKDLELDFQFENEFGAFNEKIFAVEIDLNQKIDLTKNPCDEHIDFIWVSYDGAFELFDYVSQKDALNKLCKTSKKAILHPNN